MEKFNIANILIELIMTLMASNDFSKNYIEFFSVIDVLFVNVGHILMKTILLRLKNLNLIFAQFIANDFFDL